MTSSAPNRSAAIPACRLLLADACRNDPVVDRSRRVTADLNSVTRPQTAQPPGGVAALFSCSAGELAFEHEELKHGVFFHYLIKGLQGEADLDGDERVGNLNADVLSVIAGARKPTPERGNVSSDPVPEWMNATAVGIEVGVIDAERALRPLRRPGRRHHGLSALSAIGTRPGTPRRTPVHGEDDACDDVPRSPARSR